MSMLSQKCGVFFTANLKTKLRLHLIWEFQWFIVADVVLKIQIPTHIAQTAELLSTLSVNATLAVIENTIVVWKTNALACPTEE